MCLYKVATAALKTQSDRKKLVTDSENFPSDIQILGSACASAGHNHHLEVVDTSSGSDPMGQLVAALDDSTALVSLSHVSYKSGWRWNLREVNEVVESCGALVLWDFSHSIGAVPIDVATEKVGLAVGCTYKYLNGGPGAPAFIYVSSDYPEFTNPCLLYTSPSPRD